MIKGGRMLILNVGKDADRSICVCVGLRMKSDGGDADTCLC